MKQREIKFRAWNKNKKLMFNAEYIFSFIQKEERKGVFTIMNETFPMEKIELMQFTGLKDKNGKEIYEGDIVRTKIDEYDEWINKKVVYGLETHYPAFDLEPDEDLECNNLQYFVDEGQIEVIGNIYENPELLK